MKKTNLILFLFMIVLIDGVMAETTMNFLTKGFADSLYCRVNAECNLLSLNVDSIIVDSIITGNLSIIGDVFNVTMNLVTWNITESFNVGGNLIAKNITADEIESGNITINTGVNANPTLKYREGAIDNGFDITTKLFATNYLEFNAIDGGVSTTRFKIRRLAAEIESYSNIDFQNKYNITNLECLEIDNKVICDWDSVNDTTDTSSFLTNNSDINIKKGNFSDIQTDLINSSQSEDSSLVLDLKLNGNVNDSSQYKKEPFNNGVDLIKDVGEFNGSGTYVDVTDVKNNFNRTKDFTLEGWVKWVGTDRIYMLGAELPSRFVFGKRNEKAHFRYTNATGSGFTLESTTTFTINEWTFIAVTYESSTQTGRIYYNGNFENSLTIPIKNDFDVNTILTIGATSGTGRFWNGSIACVKIYNRALDLGDIQNEMAGCEAVNNYFHANNIEVNTLNVSTEFTNAGDTNLNGDTHVKDNSKICYGDLDDYCCWFSGEHLICNPEVGSPQFQILGDGNITGDLYVGDAFGDQILVPKGTTANPPYSFVDYPTTGLYTTAVGELGFVLLGNQDMRINSESLIIRYSGTAATPALRLGSETNTGIFRPSTDNLAFSAGTIEFLRFAENTIDVTIFNEQSADIDFRVETDTETHMFYIDSGEKLINISGGYGSTGVTIYDDGNISMNGNLIIDGNVGIGTTTPNEKLTVVGNVNVTGNITVDTIYAKAINISNSSFSFTHDENDSISYSVQNLNNGSGATSLIKTLNDVGGIFGIGIASSSYLLGTMLKPNMTALFSRSSGEMDFINSFKQPFVWYNNPSDDDDLNNLVEIMRLNRSGLNVPGNLTLEFGDLVSEQNPDGADAIRIKGTDYIDVVIGGMTGLFAVWNVADDTPVFYVNERGNTVITGDLTVDGTIIFKFGQTIDGIKEHWITITENLKVNGNINQTGNFTGNQFYGEMWNYTANVSAWTFSIASSSVYYNLTGLGAGELNGFTFSDGNQASGGSKLTAQVAGLYDMSFDMSFEATSAGGLYGFAAVKNYDITQNRKCYARRYGTGNAGNVANGCFVRLEIGDTINLQIEDEFDPPKNIKIHTVTLKLVRVGD